MSLTFDQQKKIDDAVFLLKRMQLGEDVIFSESLRKRIFEDVILAENIDSTLTDINATTNVPVGGGDVTHAKSFDKRLRVNIDGSDYYIGLYNI